MTSRYRSQSLDRRDRSLVERDYANHFGGSTSSSSQIHAHGVTSNGALINNSDDVTDIAWRKTLASTGKSQGRLLRKSGLTTSRSGELKLSSGSETIQRRGRSGSRNELDLTIDNSASSSAFPIDADNGVDGSRAILTVNTVSNAVASASRSRTSSVSGQFDTLPRAGRSHSVGRYDSLSTAAKSDTESGIDNARAILTVNTVSNAVANASRSRTQSFSGGNGERTTPRSNTAVDRDWDQPISNRQRLPSSASAEKCRLFEDQLTEWTATLDKLSRLSTNVGRSDASKPFSSTTSGQRFVTDEPVIVRQTAQRTDWQSTLPDYIREPSRAATSGVTSTSSTLNRSHHRGVDNASGSFMGYNRVSGERGYASDSEDSMDWLERQRNRLNANRNTGTTGRRWAGPPRTETERKLIAELRASQEKLFGSQLDDLTSTLDGNNNSNSSNRKYFTLDSSSSSRGRQQQRAADNRQLQNGYAKNSNGVEGRSWIVNGHGDHGSLQRSVTLTKSHRAPVVEEPVLKITIDKTAKGYTPDRLDSLERQFQRSNTLPRRWQPGTRPLTTNSSDRSDSGYYTESSKKTIESTTYNVADFNRDAMLATMPRVTKLDNSESEEIHLRPIGPGFQALEQPHLAVQLNRRLLAVQAEHSDSSASLPTLATSNVNNGIYDQPLHCKPAPEQQAISSHTLMSYANNWHEQQHGNPIALTQLQATNWSQTLPSQRMPLATHQQQQFSSQISGTTQRTHRRTQSSSNVIGAAREETSYGDYEELNNREALPNVSAAQSHSRFTTTFHALPQQQQLPQFPVVDRISVQPQLHTVHQNVGSHSTAQTRHRRTQSQGMADHFYETVPGSLPQQTFFVAGQTNQTQQPVLPKPNVQPVVNAGNVTVTQTVIQSSTPSQQQHYVYPSSQSAGSLPGHYQRQQQQQQQFVGTPVNVFRSEQHTVQNFGYQPQTMQRHGFSGQETPVSQYLVSPVTTLQQAQRTGFQDVQPAVRATGFVGVSNQQHIQEQMGKPQIIVTPPHDQFVGLQPGPLISSPLPNRDVQGSSTGWHVVQQPVEHVQHHQYVVQATSNMTEPNYTGVIRNDAASGSTLQSHNTFGRNAQTVVSPRLQQQQPPQIALHAGSNAGQSAQFEHTTVREQSVPIQFANSQRGAVAVQANIIDGQSPSQNQHHVNITPPSATSARIQSNNRTQLEAAIGEWDQLLTQEDSKNVRHNNSGQVGVSIPANSNYHVQVVNRSTPSQQQQQQQRQQPFNQSFDQSRSGVSGYATIDSTSSKLSSSYPPISPEDYTIKREHGTMPSHFKQFSEVDGTTMRASGASTDTDHTSSIISADRSSVGSLSVFGDFGIEPPDLQKLSIKFVKDTSKLWYRPDMSREDAVASLKDQPTGSFVVRNSNSYPGAFALAIKVAQLPANITSKGRMSDEDLVRNFLIETTPHGVRLKGNKNEPVFGSLAALIYQHTITPISLPCKLVLPNVETSTLSTKGANSTTHQQLLQQHGAACMVIYVNTVDVETLTGAEALDKAITKTLEKLKNEGLTTTLAQFKVSSQGVTLTDTKHRIFFRRHYNMHLVIYCGLDRKNRRWTQNDIDTTTNKLNSCIFGFVSRKPGQNAGNECHVLADYDPEHSASSVVDFLSKTMKATGTK